MLTVSAEELKNNLFFYLEKIENGETVLVKYQNRQVARMISAKKGNWRDKMTVRPKLLVSADELIQPMEDIWEDYLYRLPDNDFWPG